MIHAADLFCGAGGTSTGLALACKDLNQPIDLVAVNCWQEAVDAHAKNHPWARHKCARLEAEEAQPRALVPGGKLDILAASPECVEHSYAGAKEFINDQRRVTAFRVVDWLSALRVQHAVIENVPPFAKWGPVDSAGRKIKSRAGETFKAFLNAICSLGFHVEHRILNAADYGAATTRKRLFILATRRRGGIRWPEPTHAKDPGKDLFLERQTWVPARAVIDWNVVGRSIYRRKRPLKEKSLRRIEAGIIKFRWPVRYVRRLHAYMKGLGYKPVRYDYEAAERAEAMIVMLRNHADGRSVDSPVPTLAASGNHVGLAMPGSFVLSQQAGGAPRSVEEPVPGVTCDGAHALVAPYYSHGSGLTCSSTEAPLPTVTAKSRFGLVVPVTHSKGGNHTRSIESPLPTLTCAKGGEFGLVMPVTHGGGVNRAKDIGAEPLPTITGAHSGELALITAAFGERAGQRPRVHSIDNPVPTICAEGRIQLAVGQDEDDDILFRMFETHELSAAMGFPPGYYFHRKKVFATRMIGNAVEVHQAKALIRSLIA